MRNIIDYIEEHKNDDFEALKFNEIDAAILCQLSYMNLEILAPKLEDNRDGISIKEFNKEEYIPSLTKGVFAPNDNILLLLALCESKRYEDLIVNYISYNTCFDSKEQFFAVTFIINDMNYITYRGTDMTLVGWREDFDMAYMKEVPAQKEALNYLCRVYNLKNKNISVLGHSKGGNLAVYASMYAKEEIKNNIINIYDFDGPGFNEHVYDLAEYKYIEDKVLRRIADKTVIGLLMYHTDKYELVKTSGVSILRHLLFNWHIDKRGKFVRAAKLDFNSQVIASTVINYLAVTEEDERRDFVNKLFYLLEENPKLTIFDVKDNLTGYTKSISRRYREMNKSEKALFKSYIMRVRNAYIEGVRESIKSKVNNMKNKNKGEL